VVFHLDSLPGALLAWTSQSTIWIDPTAQGYGWYTDVSPTSAAAFTQATGAHETQAAPGSPAYGHVDLLTVVTHELGHVLGFASIDAGILGYDWMTATLGTGVRRYPDAAGTGGTAPAPNQPLTAVTGLPVSTVSARTPEMLPIGKDGAAAGEAGPSGNLLPTAVTSPLPLPRPGPAVVPPATEVSLVGPAASPPSVSSGSVITLTTPRGDFRSPTSGLVIPGLPGLFLAPLLLQQKADPWTEAWPAGSATSDAVGGSNGSVLLLGVLSAAGLRPSLNGNSPVAEPNPRWEPEQHRPETQYLDRVFSSPGWLEELA
jgi:hypothetical protein